MSTYDFSNWDERYEISDWNDKVWCITPGEIIEKLLKEEDEYGNFFTSYTELSRVCQEENFPIASIHRIAILCIRHETKLLAQGIRNERLPRSNEDNKPEMVESVAQVTNNISISHDGASDDIDEDLYAEIEDHYKFDGDDEKALSFFFNYLVSSKDPGVQLNLRKFIELLILSVVFHINVEYDLTDEEYEWSNTWVHDVAMDTWKVAGQSGINIRGLNLFVEKLYLESLFEKLGSDRVPIEDVEEAREADELFAVEDEYGPEIFWEAARLANKVIDDATEWHNFIETTCNNLILDVYPMWTVFTDEAVWYDDFEVGKYPRGW
ncbi:hypothetical protein IKW75_01775 [Candidatus Saccharibacteria bacterium]|nr:hypothetical protein [Candidatus Saccharibacteria bacterium]